MTTEPGESVIPRDGIFQDGNALASLAILSVDLSEGKISYYDHFVPFVIEALATGCGGRGNTQEITDALYSEFGLKFPLAVVRNILKRTEKRGEIEHHRDEDVFSASAGAGATFKSHRDDALRQQASLAQALVDFSKKNYDLSWTFEEAEIALQDFVAKISTSRIKQVLGSSSGSSNGQVGSSSEITQSFVVGEFVTYIVHRDPVAFTSLENLVKGSMLAAALYLPISPQSTRKFRNTTIWIDAPVALLWLGLDGAEAQSYIGSMMDLAKRQGANLGMFTHCVQELRSIVRGAADGISYLAPGLRPSKLTVRFRDDKMTFAEALLLSSSIEQKLAGLSVVFQDAPDHDPRYGIEEEQWEAMLQETVNYQSDGARLCDLASLIGVHRLRKGVSSDSLEDCRAVLMTANPKVTRAARRFSGINGTSWPLAIVDHDVAALLWSKEPMDAPDLPRNQIIANALAVLHPSQDLWTRYCAVLDQLAESDADLTDAVLVLRNSSEARRLLMGDSMGDPSRVTPGLVQSILKEIKESAVAPVMAERDTLSEKLDSTSKENIAMRRRLEAVEQKDARLKDRAIKSSESWAKVVRTCTKIASVALIIGFLLSLASPTSPLLKLFPSGFQLYISISAGIVTVVGAFFLYKGHTFEKLADSLGTRAQKFIQKRKFEGIGLDSEFDSKGSAPQEA